MRANVSESRGSTALMPAFAFVTTQIGGPTLANSDSDAAKSIGVFNGFRENGHVFPSRGITW